MRGTEGGGRGVREGEMRCERGWERGVRESEGVRGA